MKVHKSYSVSNCKAVEQDGEGIVEAIVSVFGNVDLVGDRVVKGAFAKSIAKWQESGKQIPVIFSHQWDNLDAHVGGVTEVKETDEGLYTKQVYDLEDPAALKTYRLIKSGRLTEFSFAYDVVREKKASDGANELLEVNLIEVGPTLKGANPDTFVLAVKADETPPDEGDAGDETPAIEVKAGRVLSTKNENKLREAVSMIQEVLSAVEQDDGKSQQEPLPEGKDEEPDQAKSEDLKVNGRGLFADLIFLESRRSTTS